MKRRDLLKAGLGMPLFAHMGFALAERGLQRVYVQPNVNLSLIHI